MLTTFWTALTGKRKSANVMPQQERGLELEKPTGDGMKEGHHPRPGGCKKAAASEENFGVPAASKCPFLHGTVYAQPSPGYVHGNPKTGVCPKHCRPLMNAELTDKETAKETLLREALEYQELYCTFLLVHTKTPI
jgi:hypothetical protein